MMKKYFLLLLILCAAHVSEGQNATGNVYQPNTLPGYNAVSLVEQATFPTGNYTGTPAIAAPIYTIASRSLGLPIGLTYHAGGVQVGTVASWVGLNWHLEAGGVIARVVRGNVDTYTCTAGNCTATQDEPDEFYYNIAGRKGKFVYLAGVGFQALPLQHLSITATWSAASGAANITGFKVVDEGGTQYTLNIEEQTRQHTNATAGTARASAWYLFRVVASDRSDSLTLEYENYTVAKYYVGVTAKNVFGGTPYFTSTAQGTYATAPVQISYAGDPNIHCTAITATQVDKDSLYIEVTAGKRLTKINFATGYVSFVKKTTGRCDIIGDNALEYIRVFNLSNVKILEFKLVTSYFGGTCTTPPTKHNNALRLRLDALQQLYAGGSKNISTNFTYHSTVNLPPRNSADVDYWGYYNAKGNTVIAPKYNGSTFGARRNVNPLSSLAGQLIETSTTQGARTQYTYENHRDVNDTLVGGLRIQKIETQPNSQDGAADNIIRVFRYTQENGSSSGNLFDRPAFEQVVYKVNPGPDANTRVACPRIFTVACTHTAFRNETHIGYSRVVVDQGSSGQYGRSAFTYSSTEASHTDSTASGNYKGAPPTRRDWKRGLALGTKLYDMTTTSTPVLVQTSSTTYKLYGSGSTNFRRQNVSLAMSYNYGGDTYNLGTTTYAIEQGWYHPTATTSTAYTSTPGAELTTQTYYTYDATIRQLRRSQQQGSDGSWVGSETKYAEDYSIASTTDSTTLAIKNIKDRGIKGVAIESISYRRETTNSAKQITGGSIARFKNITINGHTIAKPYQSFALRTASPVDSSAFVWSSVNGSGVFTADSRYGYPAKHLGSVMGYSTWGQPLLTADQLGVFSHVVYDDLQTHAKCSVAGAYSSQTAFADFEQVAAHGWTLPGTGSRITTDAYTGTSCYRSTTGSPVFSKSCAPDQYIVSFWLRGTGTATLSHSGGAFTATSAWQLITTTVNVTSTGNVTLTLTGSDIKIDDLRLHPLGSLMTTTIYTHLVGTASSSNAQNQATFQEYDDLLRPTLTRDHNRDIRQSTTYHIKGE